jgi:putative membrane protein
MESKNFNFIFINFLFFAVVISYILILLSGKGIQGFFMIAFFTIIIFLFALWHSIVKLGIKNALIFLFLSGLASFFAEVIGVNFGYAFGSYSYSELLGPRILGVPILVFLMWIAIIYVAYQVSEHITNFRFTAKTPFLIRVWISFWSALLTSQAVAAWDLALDPIATNLNWWIWTKRGEYFGVPIENFIGWIVISFVAVFIYKLFFEKEKLEREEETNFAPLVCYTLLCFSTIFMALNLGESIFAFIAFCTMFPFICVMIVRLLVLQFKFPLQYKR